MSERFRIQDGTGVVIDNEPVGIQKVVTNAAPTASAAGYAIGCEWTNIAGTVGGIFYINTGTALVAVWTNIT